MLQNLIPSLQFVVDFEMKMRVHHREEKHSAQNENLSVSAWAENHLPGEEEKLREKNASCSPTSALESLIVKISELFS